MLQVTVSETCRLDRGMYDRSPGKRETSDGIASETVSRAAESGRVRRPETEFQGILRAEASLQRTEKLLTLDEAEILDLRAVRLILSTIDERGDGSQQAGQDRVSLYRLI